MRAMLLARGYTSVGVTHDVLETILKDTEHVMKAEGHPHRPNVRVYVFVVRISIRHIRSILESLSGEGCILVSLEPPTPFARREGDNDPLVQFMLARDVCANLVRHALVPRQEEVFELPDGISTDHLPRMLESDVVARYYDWRPGTIVRVTRSFCGHEPVHYFRLVVATSV